QEFGWYKAESRVVVRIPQHHDKAIRGVVTGSEPSFHELGANTSTLIGWEDCHRCQPSCLHGGSPRRNRHRAEGDVAAVEPRATAHPPQRAVCGYASAVGCGRACAASCPLSSAAIITPESASPSGCSPPVNYSPRICPAVSSHSSSDVTPLKNRRKVSLTKRRMFLPRALVMRVSVR